MCKKLKVIPLLAVMVCMFAVNLNASAAENAFMKVQSQEIEVVNSPISQNTLLSDPVLTACNIGIGITSGGLSITLDTTASQIANEIGARDIILQEKTLFGWKDITIGNDCTYNSDVYSGGYIYTLATAGTTYRVKCTHYAKFGSKELTLKNTSSELKFN